MQVPYLMSASNLALSIKEKKISSQEVIESFLSRIRQVNPKINAIQQINEERLLLEARKADDILYTNAKIGPLHGVPVTIKDAFYIKNLICSKGCISLAQSPSLIDASVIKRLKEAGAIILGVTNTPELLLSYETDNLLYGRTNNPYKITKTAGGSSGGEAAALAAACSPAGLGTDAGGSIRQPAHYCGVCGHKPSNGLVPLTGDIPFNGEAGLITPFLTAGPMSRHIEDIELIMPLISGPDGKDPHAIFHFPIENTPNLCDIKIAYFYNINDVIADTETVLAINDVVRILKRVTKSIEFSYPSAFDDVFFLHWETFMFGGDGGESLQSYFDTMGQKNISRLALDFIDESKKYRFDIKELKRRFVLAEQFRYQMMAFMENYDIIISSVSPSSAPNHGEANNRRNMFTYTTAHNLTGWPATVIPCKINKEGLPIGIQIAGKPLKDNLTIKVAKFLQNEIGKIPLPNI